MGVHALDIEMPLSMTGVHEAWKRYQAEYHTDPFETLTLMVSGRDVENARLLVEHAGCDGLYFNRVVIDSSFPPGTWFVSGQHGMIFGYGVNEHTRIGGA